MSQQMNLNKPFYELQLNNVTLDQSQSLQYIMSEQSKVKPTLKPIIYKHEYGNKYVFFTRH